MRVTRVVRAARVVLMCGGMRAEGMLLVLQVARLGRKGRLPRRRGAGCE